MAGMTRPADLEAYVARIGARLAAGGGVLDSSAPAGSPRPVFVARAPGRLDVMGGIADYSGSLVLQWPIRESTRVAVQRRPDRLVYIESAGPGGVHTARVPIDLFENGSAPYARSRDWFNQDHSRHWAAYVAGVFHVLAREESLHLDSGATILVESDVPQGKGVSSSAAIEAATIEAVLAAWNHQVDPRMRAIRCQQVENLVVGAPCGVMDQMTAICGEAGSLMALLCQPAEFQGTIKLPSTLAVWGLDSGIRHAVTGADYGDVRVGAFMGYRILADLAGLPVSAGVRPGHVRIEDHRWHGYLANVSPGTFLEFEHAIPGSLNGEDFLSRYGGTTDLVTEVNPNKTYAVWKPTAHPIYEHARVMEWGGLLTGAEGAGGAWGAEGEGAEGAQGARGAGAKGAMGAMGAVAARLGALMYQSHESYSACGLGSDGTDLLVKLAREAGEAEGIFGAKITGGGSGGTVAILGRRDAGDRVAEIGREYERRTDRTAYLFEGSSPGSAAVPVVRVDP
jgi:galactokinase